MTGATAHAFPHQGRIRIQKAGSPWWTLFATLYFDPSSDFGSVWCTPHQLVGGVNFGPKACAAQDQPHDLRGRRLNQADQGDAELTRLEG
jgi:hypothetical protein